LIDANAPVELAQQQLYTRSVAAVRGRAPIGSSFSRRDEALSTVLAIFVVVVVVVVVEI
jgi:hypothetical protein